MNALPPLATVGAGNPVAAGSGNPQPGPVSRSWLALKGGILPRPNTGAPAPARTTEQRTPLPKNNYPFL